MMPLALWAAMTLKAGTRSFYRRPTGPHISRSIAVSIPIFVRFGLYRAVIRYIGHKAVFAVAFAVVLSGIVLASSWVFGSICPALSWSVVAIYSCLALLYIAGSRFLVRYYFLTRHIQPTEARVAIYGAGEAGARLSTVLSTTRAFDPLVFIDDNRSLHGRMVNGIKVYPPEELPALIKERNIDRILLALPSLTRRRRREILSSLEPLGVHVQTVPGIRADRHRQGERRGHSRSGCMRPSRARFRAPEGGPVRRMHPRSCGDGDGRRRLHRLGAVPADHRLGSEAAGALRDVRACPLQHRARAARLSRNRMPCTWSSSA